MRPVNLLPEQHRPRRASGGLGGSSYVVLGILGALLVASVMYVLTANQVNARKADVVEAKRDVRTAEAKLAKLDRFGNFATIAATRKASVASLSQARFDWERFMRELAHVMPAGMWLTSVDATVKPEGGSDGATTGENAQPGAKLEGCAKRQSDVARLMVRLRKLHRVDDVTLDESVRGDSSNSGSSTSSGSSSSAGATDSGGCGRLYKFNVTSVFSLELEAPSAGGAVRVPARLGGGS